MWNLKKHIFLPMSLLLLLSACMGDEIVEPAQSSVPEGTPVAVSFSMAEFEAVAPQTATRAVGDTPLQPGETMRVVVYRSGSLIPANYVAERTYLVKAGSPNTLEPCTVDDNGLVNGLAEDLFLIPNQTYDFYAYSPARGITDHKTIPGVKHGDDFLASKKTYKLLPNNPKITFDALEHKCAMIEFNVQSDPRDPSVSTCAGKSITIKNISKSPASYILGDVGVTPAAQSGENVTLESFNQTDETHFTAQKIVLPKAAGKFNIDFTVLINGTEYLLTASDVDLAFEAGKKYVWTVECQRKGVVLGFKIINWNEENYSSKAGIPAPLQEPANSYMVAPGKGISFEMKLPGGSDIANKGQIARAELLWQTKDPVSSALMVEHSSHVVWDNERQRIRVYTNEAAAKGGYATVVAYTVGGQEVYRWLIWVTSYNPSGALNAMNKKTSPGLNKSITTNVVDGAVHTYDNDFFTANGNQAVIMDRNLGASEFYPGCYFFSGSKNACSPAELFTATGEAYSQNETTVSTAWKDHAGGDIPAKSVDDPCPYGWRVPGDGTWNAFPANCRSISRNSWVYLRSDFAKFPVEGYYWMNTNSFDNSDMSVYWTDLKVNGSASCLIFSGYANIATDGEEMAGHVRCVQDATKFPYGTPVLELTITDLTESAATLNGIITSDGGVNIQSYGFYYSTSSFADGRGTKVPASNLSNGAFSVSLSPLTKGTTIYVQAYATTQQGTTVYTPVRSFTPLGPPFLVLLDVDVSFISASFKASVDHAGGETSIREAGFIYSAIPYFNPATQGTKIKSPQTDLGDYDMSVTHLEPGTTYNVCAYATNSLGTVYSSKRSFTTSIAPVLSSPGVSDLTGTSVSFWSSVLQPDPSGVSKWGFEYSRNADFPAGAETVVVPFTGSNKLGGFNKNVTGLPFTTTYYMRAYAENVVGKTYTPSVRFTTHTPPTVTTLAVTGGTWINGQGFVNPVLNGRLDKTGSATVTVTGFEYSNQPNFVAGTGTRIVVGSGSLNSGAFTSVPSWRSDQDYYIRAYATSIAGTSYGDVVHYRLNYRAPTQPNVDFRVWITDRALKSLTFHCETPSFTGNAEMEWGMMYQEEGSGAQVFVPNATLSTPRLKIFTRYTLRGYTKDFRGTYLSAASANERTLRNYVTQNGVDYVLDTRYGDARKKWSEGFTSLTLVSDVGDETPGYDATRSLVGHNDWTSGFGRRFPAATECWNRSTTNGERWFLPSVRELGAAFGDNLDDWPSEYHPEGRGMIETATGENGFYWCSGENTSPLAWGIFRGNDGNIYWQPWGKNYTQRLRCMRKRVLPADE